jgi:hypothetical protein
MSAVSYIIPDSPLLASKLRGRLMEERAKRLEQLINCQSWEDFQQRRGAIMGLADAIKLCEDAEQDVRN